MNLNSRVKETGRGSQKLVTLGWLLPDKKWTLQTLTTLSLLWKLEKTRSAPPVS